MLWWRDALYVGTNRTYICHLRASVRRNLPSIIRWVLRRRLRTPRDPMVNCPEDDLELPLQAEIWRWTAEQDVWQRVYRSPQDVPVPGHPGRYIARDIGFRGMAAFAEPDGTEALYVTGVSARSLFLSLPGPRLLRSLDGRHFEGVPQEPGTFLGDLDTFTLRSILSFDQRLFLITGRLDGSGILLEARHPARGNDAFRQVSPPGMLFFEMIVYNGHIYLGVEDAENGYAIVRTDATGDPPYAFEPIVTQGGSYPGRRSQRPISMHVFKGCLYVGMDRPQAEILRIHPDDSWELVVGLPRETPNGWKHPLVGLDAGFGNWLNGHIWRMQTHGDRLYVGTMNMGAALRFEEWIDPTTHGFELYSTEDGWRFSPITTNGFGHALDYGVRTLASTPHGLFLGTANNWQACHIWRGTAEPESDRGVLASAESPTIQHGTFRGPTPRGLELEELGEGTLLSWAPVPGTRRYHIWRAELRDKRPYLEAKLGFRALIGALRLARLLRPLLARVTLVAREMYMPPLAERLWTPEPYEVVGTTSACRFADRTGEDGVRYAYFVQSEVGVGRLSAASNIVTVPLLAPPMTFDRLLAHVEAHAEGLGAWRMPLLEAHERLVAGNPSAAAVALAAIADELLASGESQFAVSDMGVMLEKLGRRLQLAQEKPLLADRLISGP